MKSARGFLTGFSKSFRTGKKTVGVSKRVLHFNVSIVPPDKEVLGGEWLDLSGLEE